VVIEHGPLRDRKTAFAEDNTSIPNGGKSIGCQMVRPLLRNKNEMCMRHAKSVHQHANAQRLELGPKSATDPLRNNHNPLCHLVIEIRKVVDVLLGDHEALTGSGWPQGHESHEGVILKDYAGW